MENQNNKQLNEGRNITTGQFIYGGFPKMLNEAKKKKAKKDYDQDGTLESPEAEYKGSVDRAIKKKMQSEEIDLTDIELIEELVEEVFGEDLDLLEAVVEKKKWIQKAIKKEGSLRKTMKTKEGKTIPVSKLEKAAKKGGKTGKRARLALTLRKLNEAQYNIPAKASDMDNDEPSQVGMAEFKKILSGGGHPIMAGQVYGGKRGIPPEIRKSAIQHIETLEKHPQGKIEGYSKDHPVFKQGMEAHQFFKKHFPEFGVEDEIASNYNLFDI